MLIPVPLLAHQKPPEAKDIGKLEEDESHKVWTEKKEKKLITLSF